MRIISFISHNKLESEYDTNILFLAQQLKYINIFLRHLSVLIYDIGLSTFSPTDNNVVRHFTCVVHFCALDVPLTRQIIFVLGQECFILKLCLHFTR